MRTILWVVLLCLVSDSSYTQHIFDEGSSHIIKDAISSRDTTIVYSIYGSCRSGRVASIDGTVYLYYPNIWSGGLSMYKDQWVALASHREVDDIFPNITELAYLDGDGNKRSHVIDSLEEFTDFVYYKKDRIAIYSAKLGKVLIHDLDGAKVTEFKAGHNIQYLAGNGGYLYAIEEQAIHHIDDETGSVIHKVDFANKVSSYDFSSDTLYVAQGRNIEIYNSKLEKMDAWIIPSDIIALYATDSVIYTLYEEGAATIVDSWSGGQSLERWEVESDFFEYKDFVKGSDHALLYGRQVFNADKYPYISHGILKDVHTAEVPYNDVSIEMDSIREITDTLRIHNTPSGPMAEVDYAYTMQFTITNISDVVVEQVRIVSNSEQIVNCAQAELVIDMDDLSLAPGTSIQIDTILNSIRRFEEVCLYVVSVNGQVDKDRSNNMTCKTTVHTEETSHENTINIYPNPVASYLHVQSHQDVEMMTIYNSMGQLVRKHRVGKGTKVDVRDLDAGVYHIKLQYASQRSFTMHSFLKI